MADALEFLRRRRSALKLGPPGPDAAALESLLQAAVCAPDHGRLRPWRFRIIEGEGRTALGDVLAASLRRRDPAAAEAALARERDKALRAPTIVVVGATFATRPGVPEVEQVVAAGGAANYILLAALALGFGGMWRTGPAAYDPQVRMDLGFKAEDALVGFLYLGTPALMPPPREPESLAPYASRWP
jgi:nitroreductase